MLDKAEFTEKAYTAILIALYEASPRAPQPVTPAHLLLGLQRADPELFRLLSPTNDADVTECLRDKLKRFASNRRGSQTVTARPPLSSAMQEIIEFAKEQSRARGHSKINTGHLLFGLLASDQLCEQPKMFGFVRRKKLSIKQVLIDCGLDAEHLAEKINDENMTPQSRPVGSPVLRGKSSRARIH